MNDIYDLIDRQEKVIALLDEIRHIIKQLKAFEVDCYHKEIEELERAQNNWKEIIFNAEDIKEMVNENW